MQKNTGTERKVLQKMAPFHNQSAKNILNIIPRKMSNKKNKSKNRKINKIYFHKNPKYHK
jgi:hypothetical protein